MLESVSYCFTIAAFTLILITAGRITNISLLTKLKSTLLIRYDRHH